MAITLGSLFDGIGGWQFAAVECGIVPVWSSEIEAFPLSVTAKHFPNTKQLGDIKGINGAEIEPVDIICAGSPCQDLSVAGNRAGLEGERSGLFRNAIDIVRQMRRATGGHTQSGSSGRTCLEHSARIKGLILNLCWKKSQRPTFQCLEVADGQKADWLEAQSVISLGESLTLNTGESPSVERESFLWQILEKNADRKYCLSPKACAGILRKAKTRGKILPDVLEKVLTQQAKNLTL